MKTRGCFIMKYLYTSDYFLHTVFFIKIIVQNLSFFVFQVSKFFGFTKVGTTFQTGAELN